MDSSCTFVATFKRPSGHFQVSSAIFMAICGKSIHPMPDKLKELSVQAFSRFQAFGYFTHSLQSLRRPSASFRCLLTFWVFFWLNFGSWGILGGSPYSKNHQCKEQLARLFQGLFEREFLEDSEETKATLQVHMMLRRQVLVQLVSAGYARREEMGGV